jgi:osmotically-inducible protein OsmY
VTTEWEAGRGYGGGAEERGASQPHYGPRGYWRDRPSWQQDPYGFGQRSHWRESYPDRPDPHRGRFPRDQYGREHSSEQLFERAPFGRREDTHYYGTGSAGWGGPGFTGGAYAYGDSSRYQQQGLEGEYTTESALSYEDQLQRDYRNERRMRRYPPGPKGYQRSDERLKEDISERLYGAYHIDSSEVTISVMGGKATLDGVVPSRHMKHAIEDMVDACPGVTEIDNRIRVESPGYQGSSKAPLTQPVTGSKSKQ